MPSNEKTSPKVAKVAAQVLSTGKATPQQALTLAGAVLTQAADKPKAAPPKAAPKKSGK